MHYALTSPYTGATFTATVDYGITVQMIGYEDEGARVTVKRDSDGATESVDIGSVSIAHGGVHDALSSAARKIEGVL